jgi:hypothetical protein
LGSTGVNGKFKTEDSFASAITRLAATDWLGSTGVNGKFETEDSFASAGFVENCKRRLRRKHPSILDKHFNLASGGEIDVSTNFQMLAEFGRVTGTVPEMDVGAGGLKSGWDATDRFPILGKNQKIVVDVITRIERNGRQIFEGKSIKGDRCRVVS